jgi:hypothetical protein
MKKIIIGSLLTAGILLAGSVQAKSMNKNLEAHLVKICEAIRSDSKIKLHIAIRDSGIKTKAISKGLVCNGYDPVTFAIVSKAENTAKFMASKGNVDYEALLAKL